MWREGIIFLSSHLCDKYSKEIISKIDWSFDESRMLVVEMTVVEESEVEWEDQWDKTNVQTINLIVTSNIFLDSRCARKS